MKKRHFGRNKLSIKVSFGIVEEGAQAVLLRHPPQTFFKFLWPNEEKEEGRTKGGEKKELGVTVGKVVEELEKVKKKGKKVDYFELINLYG
jgi:hypothetical protein